MKTRIISAAILIPFALTVLLVFPAIILTCVISAISAIAAYELFAAAGKLCRKTPSKSIVMYSIIASVMVPFTVFLNRLISTPLYTGALVIIFVLTCLMIIDFFLTLKSEKRIRPLQLLVTPFAALIIPYMLSSLIALRLYDMRPADAIAESSDLGRWLVILPIIITVLTDSGAYFSGVFLGKHKPLPKISPNKTVEGFIGGIIIGAAAVVIYGLIAKGATVFDVNLLLLFLYGIIGAVITEAGDLAFSLIKRKCGIKDYGKLIPGHGGVLDRFDSLIFTGPVVFLLAVLIPAFA